MQTNESNNQTNNHSDKQSNNQADSSSNCCVNFITTMLPASRENPLNAYQNPSYHNRTIIPSTSISSSNNLKAIQTTYLIQSSIQFSIGHKSGDLSPVPSIQHSVSPVNHKRRAPDPDVVSESLASLRISDQSANQSPIRKTKRVHRCVEHQSATCKSEASAIIPSTERSAFIYPLPVPLKFSAITQSSSKPVDKVSEASNDAGSEAAVNDIALEDDDDLEDEGELLHDMHSFVIDESMKPCMPYIL